MEEKNSCLDVEFIKAYLQSSIELETQKRIAEQTFNELLREENQWKQKMSYVAKKRYTKFSIWDMLFMACKGFGISLAILYVIITIIEFADFNSILFEDILYFIWFIILAMLVVVIPIYRKITDYIDMISSSHIKRKSEDDDLVIVKPDYDEDCYGLIQKVSMLEHNREAVWHEFSDV